MRITIRRASGCAGGWPFTDIAQLHGDAVATFLRQRPNDLRIKTLKIYLQFWSDPLEDALVQYLKVNTFVRSIQFLVQADYKGPVEASEDIAVAIDSDSCLLQEISFVGCKRTVNWHQLLEHYLKLNRLRVSHGARFASIGQTEDNLVIRQRLVYALETLDTTSLFMSLVRNEWDLATPIIPLYGREKAGMKHSDDSPVWGGFDGYFPKRRKLNK